MLLQTLLEGLGLGVLLVAVCAIGIRKGAVGMVHLYAPKVQERCVALGLTTKEKKWLFGTVGMAMISLILAGIGTLL